MEAIISQINPLTKTEYAARIEMMLRDCKPAKIYAEAVQRPDSEMTVEGVSDRR